MLISVELLRKNVIITYALGKARFRRRTFHEPNLIH